SCGVFISFFFFFSSRRRHTRSKRDWSSDVCSSDLIILYTMLSWLYYAFFFHIFFISENLNLQIKYIEKKQKSINKSLHIFKHNRSEERRVGKECRARGGREN